MTDALLEFFKQYPFVLYVLIIFAVVVIVIALVNLKQGRSFTSPIFGFGGKEEKKQGAIPQGQQPAIQQAPSVQQSPSIQNIINAGTLSLSDEQKDDIANRVAEKVRVIRRDVDYQPANVLYRPPNLPERIAYIYAARHDIAAKVRNIVLNPGGAWAGHSMADFNTFIDLARTHSLISRELAQEISEFYYFTQISLNQSNVDSDEQFLEIQYLALDISRRLEGESLHHEDS